MSTAKKNADFYKRMLEAKASKKQRLEQEQLAAEFGVHPERFAPPVVVKTAAEQKMDAAFSELKNRLHTERASQSSNLERSIEHLNNKLEGF